MLIAVEHRFPHRVLHQVRCIACRRRLTVVVAANVDLSEVACACGSFRLARRVR